MIKILAVFLALLIAGAWLGKTDPDHVKIATGFAPGAALLAVLAFVLGLGVRRRVGLGERHASPSMAYVSKLGTLLVADLAAAWIVFPVPSPPWTFYLLCLLFSAAAGLYVGNLPPRL